MLREGGRPRVTGLVVRVLCMWMLEHGSQKDLGGLISFFKKYLAAPDLVAACGIFSCGVHALSCSMWDVDP